MSDKGDKICPLCTEEMDLTDQQLKPCKCGYEICVWCWNQIMEMAEKDNTEGLCPACRTPYDKEKIVAMAAECERLVAELSSERKLKSQKMKPKVSDGRMHLTNVRVIQRNLVYIIGLPLNLADETLLHKRDYFGQYGKVLKVSISRTATGAIQHASNNSCCVYITYAKEEEAVRCIQSVHSFVLEGRPLRACFGTTKYCHTWLKNMPCTIPDCLYLHDFGSPDDSFTKDDLDSAFTRSRGQQIIGATNNLHRRSGDVLPPPADDYTNRNTSMAKSYSETMNNGGIYEDGYWDSGVGKSNVLPGAASWVARASVTLPSAGSMTASGVTSNKPEVSNGPQVPHAESVCHKIYIEGPAKSKRSGEACLAISTSDRSPHPSVSESQDISAVDATGASSIKLSKLSRSSSTHEELFHDDEDIRELCSEVSSVRIDNAVEVQSPEPLVSESSIQNNNLLGGQVSQQDVSDLFNEPSTSSRESTFVDDLLGFCDQRPPISYLPSSKRNLKQATNHSWQYDVGLKSTNDVHSNVPPMKVTAESFMSTSSKPEWSNGFYTNHTKGFAELDGNSNYVNSSSIVGPKKHLKEHSNAANVGAELTLDAGENSIISNILSMDCEEWEDFSLTSLQSLVKLQNETNKQHSSLKIPSSRKAKESNQSRFSFAWQDDLQIERSNVECSFGNQPDKLGVTDYFIGNNNTHLDKYNDVSANTGGPKFNGFLGNHPFIPSNTVSKSVASPMGFSATSKPVPPGFPTHGTMHHPFDQSDHLRQSSVSQFRIPSSSKSIEFADPSIVENGKGHFTTRLINPGFDVRPAIPAELSPYDHDTELQMLMQQSMSPPQNQNSFPSHFRNVFSSPADSYSISPRLLGRSPTNASMLADRQQLGNLNIPNGHWGGWNDVKSPNHPNGQMSFNKFIPNYDEMKYMMSGSSNNLYGRGFAM